MSTDPNAVTRVQFDGNGNVVDPSNMGSAPTLPIHNKPPVAIDDTSRAQIGGPVTGTPQTDKAIHTAYRQGVPVPAQDARPTDTVWIAGMETSVEGAIAAGLITRIDNKLVPLFDGETEAQSTEQQEQGKPDNEDWRNALEVEHEPFVDNTLEKAVGALNHMVSGSTQAKLVAEAIGGDGVSTNSIVAAASEIGADPNLIADVVQKAEQHFYHQAAASLRAQGFEAEAAFEWARENRPDLLKDAVRHLVTRRSTAGFKEIGQEFLLALDRIDPDAIYNAKLGNGVKIGKASDGTLLVISDGMELDWPSAVRAGIVKIN